MSKFSNKTTGILSIADLKTIKGKIAYWSMFSVLIIVCMITLLPSLWVVLTSFKDTQEIYSGVSFIPKNLTWSLLCERLEEAADLLDLERKTFNTVIIAIGSTITGILFPGLAGYVISRLKPKGSKLVFSLVVWTMMMPAQIRTVPLFMSYLSFPFAGEFDWEISLVNTYWPFWINAAANCFSILLFKNNFDTISKSYIEAARLDGCGNMRIFLNIMIPLSIPIIIYVAIDTMSIPWSDYFTPYLYLSDDSLQTLPTKVFKLQNEGQVKLNTYMMCLMLSSIPPIIIFAALQKHIMGGINIGGVKG